MAMDRQSLTMESHIANLKSLVYHLAVIILSLLPLTVSSFIATWTIATPTWTRNDVEIWLAMFMLLQTLLHIYFFAMIYNFWEPAAEMPLDWVVMYSDVIVCAVAIGAVLIVGAWRASRRILESMLTLAAEVKKVDVKRGDGEETERRNWMAKKEE